MPYIPGDYWMVCDQCGFIYRKSRMKKRWDNAWVCAKDFEVRHPQDSLRTRPEGPPPKEVRPEPADHFLAPGDVTVGDL